MKETTFSWHMTSDSTRNGQGTSIFKTANGTPVGTRSRASAARSPHLKESDPKSRVAIPGARDDERPGGTVTVWPTTEAVPRTPSSGIDSSGDGGNRKKAMHEEEALPSSPVPPVVPVVNTNVPNAVEGSAYRTPPTSSLITVRESSSVSEQGDGIRRDTERGSATSEGVPVVSGPEGAIMEAAAAAAIKASVRVIRQSAIKRRGVRNSTSASSSQVNNPTGESVAMESGVETAQSKSKPVCSKQFVKRRAAGDSDTVRKEATESTSEPKSAQASSGDQRVDSRECGSDGAAAKQTTKITESKGRVGEAGVAGRVQGQSHQLSKAPISAPADSGGAMPDRATEKVEQPKTKAKKRGATAKAKQADDVRNTTGGHVSASGVSPAKGNEVADEPGQSPAMPPVRAPPTTEPGRIVVTFSSAGSLGMGLEEDESEEGTMLLAGKSPTSAAANVPDGWRITKVDGRDVRRLGGKSGRRGSSDPKIENFHLLPLRPWIESSTYRARIPPRCVNVGRTDHSQTFRCKDQPYHSRTLVHDRRARDLGILSPFLMLTSTHAWGVANWDRGPLLVFLPSARRPSYSIRRSFEKMFEATVR